nr:hypothetical protein GCM10020241_38820 [Streptoalloteichus tenebrarius]
MTEVLFETLADESHCVCAPGRRCTTRTSTRCREGLCDLVDAMKAGSRLILPDRDAPDTARIETVVLLGLSAAHGSALGRRTGLTGLGHDPAGQEHDAAFRPALSSVFAVHLAGGKPAP